MSDLLSTDECIRCVAFYAGHAADAYYTGDSSAAEHSAGEARFHVRKLDRLAATRSGSGDQMLEEWVIDLYRGDEQVTKTVVVPVSLCGGQRGRWAAHDAARIAAGSADGEEVLGSRFVRERRAS